MSNSFRPVGQFLYAYRWPLATVIVGRAGLMLLAYLSLALIPLNNDPAMTTWDLFGSNQLLNGWARWDSGWYRAIAEDGYTAVPLLDDQRNVVFLPLYPLLIRWLGPIVPHTGLAGIFVTNVSYLIGSLALYQLVREQFDEAIAKRTIVIMAIFPFSFYFSAMYSEALFFALLALSFYFGYKSRWFWATLLCAFATSTRLLGITAIIGLLLVYFDDIHYQPRKVRRDILWFTITPLGLLLYILFLWREFSNPFIFITGRYVDGWERDAWATLVETLALVGKPHVWLSASYPVLNVLNLVFGMIGLIVVGVTFRRLPHAYTIWSILYLAAAFAGGWHNMGRYVLPLFPLYIAAAFILNSHTKMLAYAYVGSLLLAFFTTLFTHWYVVT